MPLPQMLAMHLPKPAVALKMQAEGKDPKILDMNPDDPSPNQAGASTAATQPVIKVKDDPEFAKYFKVYSSHSYHKSLECESPIL